MAATTRTGNSAEAMLQNLKMVFSNTTLASNAWEETLLDNAHRVSTPLALRMLSQMGLGRETTKPFRILENACGAGVVAPLLQEIIKPDVLKQSSILCGDFSEQSIALAKKRIEKEGWVSTEARVVDAQKTGLADGAFTHCATNIGFHVVPDSERALDEVIRILEPGGVLGFTTWHRDTAWVMDIKEAFASFPFEAPFELPLQLTKWGQWSDVNWARKTLEAKGLQDVKVDVFAYLSTVDSTDHALKGTSMMIQWVMNSCWTEEQRDQHSAEEVSGLLRQYFDKKYEGKPWQWSWVALIASGRVPA